MKLNFIEKCHTVHIATSSNIASCADWNDSGISTDVVSMKGADSAVFIITTLTNAGGAASVNIYACSNTTPSATTPISFYYKMITSGDTQGATTETKQFRTSTAANIVYVVEVPAAKCAEAGYEYIQMVTTEPTNAAIEGSIACFLTGLRYASDAEGTQLT